MTGSISNEDLGDSVKVADGVGTNTPDLGKDLKPKRRAITSVPQLGMIATTLEDAAKARNLKNGEIAKKYNGDRPYDDNELKAEGLSWKSNFTTRPLAVAIDKVPPRLTRAVHKARYLTSSSLPDTVEGGKMKTERFRAAVTKVVRNWTGWRPFLNEVAAENCTYGFTSAAWLNPYSWKPTHFRQDRFFVPDQTKQTAEYCPVWIGRQEFQIHELVQLIDDPGQAQDAGWDLEAAVEAINEARPKNVQSDSPYTDYRTYEDAIRESSVYLSLQQGSKVIEVNHFLVAEADGKVSHYMACARNKKKLLRQQLDLYGSMAEALVFFSYQQANGLLMGSKGIGRELYEVACALDRARNEFVDRLMLSGKTWVRGTQKALDRLKLSVVGNTVLLPEEFSVESVKIDAGSAEFSALDNTLTQLMDQIAGGVTPRQLQGERVTATAVNLYAAREEEKRDDITERFLLQVADIITVCQRRLADPSSVDADALRFQEEMLAIMTPEQLVEMALQPALRTVDDWTVDEAQSIILFAQEKRNDPLYDQVKLAQKSASARVNADFAQDVVLPVNDPTQEAEQARAQVLESVAMAIGKQVPVSSRDNHRIHADVLKEELPNLAAAVATDPTAAAELQAKVKHWADHLEAAMQGGALPADWDEDKKIIQAAMAELSKLSQAAPAAPEMLGAPEGAPPEMLPPEASQQPIQ
ncbi:MAG: hypothetical protein EBR82_21550 [Caulobacteraceae bacterium]|nr:hypothetical protein [Caulobacteraceae bacterium]